MRNPLRKQRVTIFLLLVIAMVFPATTHLAGFAIHKDGPNQCAKANQTRVCSSKTNLNHSKSSGQSTKAPIASNITDIDNHNKSNIQSRKRHTVGADINHNTTGIENNDGNWLSRLQQGTKGEQVQYLFVHVGKTGGASFRHALSRARPPPVLEQRLVTTTHIGIDGFRETKKTKLDMDLVNTFLFTIRPPVSRIVSAFNMHRSLIWGEEVAQKNETSLLISNPRFNYNIHFNERYGWSSVFFYDCFQTIEDVAKVLLLSPLQIAESRGLRICRYLAQKSLAGKPEEPKGVLLHHFVRNYDYYVNRTIIQRPDVPVLAVRMNHLGEDSKRLDLALGGDGSFATLKKTHGSEKYKVRSGLATSEQKCVVCCALTWQELESYQMIVRRALNLNDTEKRESLWASMAECGVDQYEYDPVYEPYPWKTWHKTSCQNLLMDFENTNH